MGTLQTWRKAYGALKDQTKVGLAHVNSDYKVTLYSLAIFIFLCKFILVRLFLIICIQKEFGNKNLMIGFMGFSYLDGLK